MPDPEEHFRPDVPAPMRPRFTIRTMLLVMFIFCVMAAAGSYLVRSAGSNRGVGVLVFIVFTLAAPMLLVVVISILRWIFLRLNRR